jgi:hypothetical protein
MISYRALATGYLNLAGLDSNITAAGEKWEANPGLLDQRAALRCAALGSRHGLLIVHFPVQPERFSSLKTETAQRILKKCCLQAEE